MEHKYIGGKSLKNALHILRYAKGTSWAEATSNSEKIKPVALAVIATELKNLFNEIFFRLTTWLPDWLPDAISQA